jgi:hypothetical protein
VGWGDSLRNNIPIANYGILLQFADFQEPRGIKGEKNKIEDKTQAKSLELNIENPTFCGKSDPLGIACRTHNRFVSETWLIGRVIQVPPACLTTTHGRSKGNLVLDLKYVLAWWSLSPETYLTDLHKNTQVMNYIRYVRIDRKYTFSTAWNPWNVGDI